MVDAGQAGPGARQRAHDADLRPRDEAGSAPVIPGESSDGEEVRRRRLKRYPTAKGFKSAAASGSVPAADRRDLAQPARRNQRPRAYLGGVVKMAVGW